MSPELSQPELATDVWLLKQRLSETGPMFRSCWDNYLKFYTVFLTFNLAAMGWFVQKDASHISHPHPIAGVFSALTLLCAITSAAIALYTRKAAKDYLALERTIFGAGDESVVLEKSPSPIPTQLAIYAGMANCIAMIGMACVWIVVGFFNLPPPAGH